MVRFLASCRHWPSSTLAAFVDFINVSITRRHALIFSICPFSLPGQELDMQRGHRRIRGQGRHQGRRSGTLPCLEQAIVFPHIAGSVRLIHQIIHTATFALIFVRQEHVQLHCTLPPIAKLDNSLNSLVKCQKLSLSTNQIDKFISLASLSTCLVISSRMRI
jgi:hypothetical protein